MIQLHITSTGKSYSPKDTYKIFDTQTKTFDNLIDAKSYLRKTYGKAKRVPMFYDDKDGKAIHCGYIIGFRVDKWLQQDWVAFQTVESMAL